MGVTTVIELPMHVHATRLAAGPGTDPPRMRSPLWHRLVHRFCARLWFDRIRVVHRERLPPAGAGAGAVLFVSLHRNGAVDGFVLQNLLPQARFLVARRLRRSRLLRLFFHGIEVVRRRDTPDRRKRFSVNEAALEECRSLLAAGGELVVFPEGTSSLGPRHLPFEAGAARILHAFLESCPGMPVTVVPLGLHYERAWVFRSRMEVVVGRPIPTAIPSGLSGRESLRWLKDRIEAGLEAVGADFASPADQERAEALAYASTLGTPRSYARSLMRLVKGVPPGLADRWETFDAEAHAGGLWRHQGVPLLPRERRHLPLYGLWFLIVAPVVAAAALLNAPPLLLSWMAARRCADDLNVVALTSLVAGVPALLAWMGGVAIVAAVSGAPWGVVPFLFVSWLGLVLAYRAGKLAVIVRNGLAASPGMQARAVQLHRAVLHSLSHECTPVTAPRRPLAATQPG